MANPYGPARSAANRWLERTKTPEYWQKKREAAHTRYQLAVLKRNARRSGDYSSIALLTLVETEMKKKCYHTID